MHQRIEWSHLLLPAGGAGFGVLVVSYLTGGGLILPVAMGGVVFLAVGLLSAVAQLLRNRT